MSDGRQDSSDGNDGRIYSQNGEDLLVALNVTFSALSACGSLYVLWNFWRFEQLRTFALQLIVFVAIGDLIASLAHCMGSPDGKKNRPLCISQAFLLQIGELTSFFWCTSIAFMFFFLLSFFLSLKNLNITNTCTEYIAY